MNKPELIDKIVENTGFNKKDVVAVLNNFQDIVKDAVIDGNKVSLSGFVTFEKKHIAAKSGVSAITGVEWNTPEKDEIKATLSKKYRVIG